MEIVSFRSRVFLGDELETLRVAQAVAETSETSAPARIKTRDDCLKSLLLPSLPFLPIFPVSHFQLYGNTSYGRSNVLLGVIQSSPGLFILESCSRFDATPRRDRSIVGAASSSNAALSISHQTEADQYLML